MTDLPTLIREGRELLAVAADTPWAANHDHTYIAFRPNPNGSLGSYHYAEIHGWTAETTVNGKLILFAVNNLPALLEAIESMAGALAVAETARGAAQRERKVQECALWEAEYVKAAKERDALRSQTEQLRTEMERLREVEADRNRVAGGTEEDEE